MVQQSVGAEPGLVSALLRRGGLCALLGSGPSAAPRHVDGQAGHMDRVNLCTWTEQFWAHGQGEFVHMDRANVHMDRIN